MSDSQGQKKEAEGTAEVMPAETKPTVTSQTQPEALANVEGDLPENASDRTRQEFEKLKAKNKELAEQLRLKEQQNRPASVMDELYVPPVREVQDTSPNYPVLTENTIEEVKQSLVDRDGYLDAQALERQLSGYANSQRQALESAKRAEERARAAEERIARFEQTQVTQELHKAFPQADPYSDKFDVNFYNHLKKEIIFQMTQGKTNPLEAAQQVTTYYKPTAPDTTKADETIVQRQQASTQTGGKRGTPAKYSEEDLVKGTRQGDLNALGERLRRSGF